MSDKYVLDASGNPVRESDLVKWAEWYETADRSVAKTAGGDANVSTVFLSLDHAFCGGPPLLFETLVFGGVLDGEMDRYSTRADALLGHERMVAQVRSKLQ